MNITKILNIYLLILLILVLPSKVFSQSEVEESVIKLTTEVVSVDAQVLVKKTGLPVGGLKKEDFLLYEDGVKQEITYFTRDQVPLSVVMLFDLTDTVRPVLKALARGAKEALTHFKPEDEVAVLTYAARIEVLQDFTKNRDKIVDAIDLAAEMKSSDPAHFNEAIYQASNYLKENGDKSRRRVIIWCTDNVPNIGVRAHSEKEAMQAAFEADVSISTILARSALSTTASVIEKNPISLILKKKYPPGDVHKYAENTGGEVVKASKEEVGGKLIELIDRIRSRYNIGYSSSVSGKDGEFRKLQLKVSAEVEKKEGQVVIKAKKGYFANAKIAKKD
ncbi:MAG: VWA domain-containing protein [Blastocatellia bacterium]|nr:VWA domain-containing protein [Blastocatellia bacterium]